jgi:hypothetical protein
LKNSEGNSPANKAFAPAFLFFLASSCAHIPSGAPLTAIKIHAEIEADGRTGRAIVFLKKPDLLRVELYGPLNRVETIMTGDSLRCSYYLEGEIKPCRWEDRIGPRELAITLLEGGSSKGVETGDYRRVGNYYLPFSIKTGAVSILIRSVELNPAIDENLFSAP